MVERPEQAANRTCEAGIRPITPGEFAAFQALILREAGINLSEIKRALLVGRLTRRLRALGLRSFRDYHALVETDAEERVQMLDCICTNETHFFREPRQFEFLAKHAIPGWAAAAGAGVRPRRLRVWSAACSTGEEPYSLAMLLLRHLPPGQGWDVEIVASDLSTRALERARAALWPVGRAAEIPPDCLREFMLRGVGPQEGWMKAGPAIRGMIRFQRLNLNDEAYLLEGAFDLILCRNVLIYFRPETKARVIERLLARLAPEGYLLLGHAESVMGLATRLRSVGPNVYVAGSGSASDQRGGWRSGRSVE